MNTTIKLKLGFLVFMITLAVVTIVPSFYASTPSWWKKYMAPEGLRLGLDLQGGMHLVLKVNLERAQENTLVLAANDLKDTLAEESVSAVQSSSPDKKTNRPVTQRGAAERGDSCKHQLAGLALRKPVPLLPPMSR